jgi:hypothetical protein
LHERQRASELLAGEKEDIAVVAKRVETLADVSPVQFAPDPVGDIIERLGHEDALLVDVRRRLREAGVL